jgi:BirA family transcriptional regulator, biotin operon repressor / biotin---[acetyl-CoA-carboxylase] ligase
MIIGSNLLFFKTLPSTNTHISDLLKKNNLPEGTIVYTNYQSKGRGYSGNKWESENGKNLLFSILLFPSFINTEDQFLISMTISLGICDFLMKFIPDCSIKWPNDIYVNNDKIAGILIESSVIGNKIESTIAGIGLNINQEKFISIAPNPVSLRMLTGTSYELSACMNKLGTDLDKRYKQLIAGNSGLIKKEYVSKLYRLNKWCEFRDIKGICTGRILAVGDTGLIKIEKRNGEICEYAFKEIEFIP